MDTVSSPALAFISDPAFRCDWEGEGYPINPPSSTYSDDIEAFRVVQEEETARKNKAGVVIQHRAWKTGEVFRSEADHPEGKFG